MTGFIDQKTYAASFLRSLSESPLPQIAAGFGSRGQVAYDNFDVKGSQPLVGRRSPSGHVWSSSGNGAASAACSNGKMTANENCYNYLSGNTEGVTRQWARFSFVPSVNSDGDRSFARIVFLAVQQAGSLNGKFFHLQITADGWTYGATNSGVSGLGNNINSGVWRFPLLTDGTQYEAAIEYDYAAHTYTIYGPDGSVNKFTHNSVGAEWTDFNSVTATIGSNDCLVPAWQIVGSTSFITFYEEVGSGPAAMNRRQAPVGEIAILRGNRFTARKAFGPLKIPGLNNTYRIMTGEPFNTGSVSGYMIVGRLRLEALDASGYFLSLWELDVAASVNAFGSQDPVITQRHGRTSILELTAITSARLSQNFSSAPYCALDLTVGNISGSGGAAPITLYGEFVGYGNMVSVPAVAASLGGTPATVNFSNG